MINRTALITGASAGIGEATASALAKENYDLIITGRRDKKLQSIKMQLEQKHSVSVKTLCFDISDKISVQSTIESNLVDLKKVSVLINNAGLAKGIATIDKANLDDWDAMIDTNIKGLLYVTRLMLPLLKAHKTAHIINLGSVAGRWVYPGGNVYCATKFAVRALSEALRMDLLGLPIRVCNIEPGLVESEFSKVRLGDNQKAKDVYKGMTPLKPEDIASCIEWVLRQPEHVNVQELVVFPTDQSSVMHVNRTL